jgi:hypothetical protein
MLPMPSKALVVLESLMELTRRLCWPEMEGNSLLDRGVHGSIEGDVGQQASDERHEIFAMVSTCPLKESCHE